MHRADHVVPRYPAPLAEQAAHAERFASALRALYDEVAHGDASVLWLTGRAEEVVVLVGDVLRAWGAGKLDTTSAAREIEQYLEALHASLEPWYGRWFAPSCCGPRGRCERDDSRVVPRKRIDLLVDTVTDGTAYLPERIALSA
jgi:hypothetical protein